MKSGATDTGAITPENLEEARKLENINLYEWWSVSASTNFVAFNLRQGFPTSDINVRHGLNYAVDKDLLTEQVMVGQGRRGCSIYPATSWGYDPDGPGYVYYTDEASCEFDQAR